MMRRRETGGWLNGFHAGVRVVRLCGLALAFLVACSSGPTDPGDGGPNGPGNGGPNGPGNGGGSHTLQIIVTGRVERGSTVDIAALRNQTPVPAGQLSWSAQPAGAAVFEAGQRVRFTAAGNVTLSVTSGEDTGSTTVQVAVPPSIVFDMTRDGNRDIYRVAIDGGDLARLTTNELDDIAPTAAGGQVVYTSYRRFIVAGTDTVAIADLYSMPVTGGNSTRRTTTAEPELGAAFSRDGQRLAYVRPTAGGVPKLWTANANGANEVRATSGFGFAGSPEVSPSWAPDRNRVVFVAAVHGNADLFVLNTSTGAVTQLTTDATPEVEPDWSPDGNWVAFVSEREGQIDIYRIRVADGHVEQLTDRAEPDVQPAYLPDGRLVFISEVGGERRLRWLDPEAPTEIHEIEIGPGTPGHPAGVF